MIRRFHTTNLTNKILRKGREIWTPAVGLSYYCDTTTLLSLMTFFLNCYGKAENIATQMFVSLFSLWSTLRNVTEWVQFLMDIEQFSLSGPSNMKFSYLSNIAMKIPEHVFAFVM